MGDYTECIICKGDAKLEVYENQHGNDEYVYECVTCGYNMEYCDCKTIGVSGN